MNDDSESRRVRHEAELITDGGLTTRILGDVGDLLKTTYKVKYEDDSFFVENIYGPHEELKSTFIMHNQEPVYRYEDGELKTFIHGPWTRLFSKLYNEKLNKQSTLRKIDRALFSIDAEA